MTNAESRDFAFKCYAKSVHAFTQRGPNCTGYVAMWLRKRSRNKPFFRADYFHVEPEGKRLSRVDERTPDGKLARGAEKAELLQMFMKGKKDARPGERDWAKEWEQNYIVSGSKRTTTALEFVRELSNQQMSSKLWDGKGMARLIGELGKNKELASLGVFADVPHALGVDCSVTPCAYFDPNLGELTFPNADWLAYWWKNCFSTDRAKNPRTNMPSAWLNMTDAPFRAEIYKRV